MVLLSQASASRCRSAGAVEAAGQERRYNQNRRHRLLKKITVHIIAMLKKTSSLEEEDSDSYQIQLSLTAAPWS